MKYRQQIIFQNQNLKIINDLKSTSFSSSIGTLKVNKNILWLLGGINKKRDKFNLPKNILEILMLLFMEKKKVF